MSPNKEGTFKFYDLEKCVWTVFEVYCTQLSSNKKEEDYPNPNANQINIQKHVFTI